MIKVEYTRPYAMRYMYDVNNYVPRKNQQHSPIELFSSTKLQKQLNKSYYFSCPAYALGSQPTGRKEKWNEMEGKNKSGG
jgi:hypothetical protein